MKLIIGENIRAFRKRKDMTQEEFSNLLGVTYQSVSRWENGVTYPDLELLPAIAGALAVTVDELIGMPAIEKEKRAEETFDALRRECMKREYDAERIAALLRDIRRNYLDSASSFRPFCEGNDRAFRDPEVLPEARLLTEAYLARHPMNAQALETMANIEEEERLPEFFQKHTAVTDCSERALRFKRYFLRRDEAKLEPERRYQLYQAFNLLLCPRYLTGLRRESQAADAAAAFMQKLLALIREDADGDRPDMWVCDRIELGLKSALHSVSEGKREEALRQIETAVRLLEETMQITDKVRLPTSCRFLDGMEWRAAEDWMSLCNDPDGAMERMIFLSTNMGGLTTCYCLFPRVYYDMLRGPRFEPLFREAEFEALCARVKALIVTKRKET